MAFALSTVRRAVAPKVDRYWLVTTATSGSTISQLEVAAYPVKNTRRGQWYLDGWILRPAKTNADRVNWVSTDGTAGSGNATGVLGVSPSWATSPYAGGAGETVELYSTWSPDEIETAINQALRRMQTLEESTITPVDRQLNYPLTSYTWITRPWHVVGLKLRSGTVANQYTYRAIKDWTVSGDEDALTLNLRSGFAASDVVVMTSLRDYYSISVSGLIAEADTTPAPLDWLAWETILDLYRTPTSLRSGATSQDETNREEARVRLVAQAMRLKYRPHVDRSFSTAMGQSFGPSGTNGVWG